MIDTSSNIRSAFIADPGKVLVVADLSQIEPRLTAHFAALLHPGEELKCPLLSAFTKGLDLYAVLANNILELGLPEDALTKSSFKKTHPTERALGKVLQLATTYGLGPDKLAWKMSKVTGKEYGYKQAKSYIDKFWTEFWDIHHLRQHIYSVVQKQEYYEQLFGRRMYMSNSDARRKGLNVVIQGSASYYCEYGQEWVEAESAACGIPSEFLMIVHDEIIYQVHREYAENFKVLLETVMCHGWKKYEPQMNLLVPIEIEAAIGDSWAVKE